MSASADKTTASVIIDLPVEKVVALYTDPVHFKEWQMGFQSYAPLNGVRLAVGSTAKVVFMNGKRRIELTETILTNNLPHELEASYDHEHMSNTQKSMFELLPDGKTRLSAQPGNVKFKSLVPRLLGWMMKGKFKEQTQKWLDQFKVFAEKK